jgi:hypothetical protein
VVWKKVEGSTDGHYTPTELGDVLWRPWENIGISDPSMNIEELVASNYERDILWRQCRIGKLRSKSATAASFWTKQPGPWGQMSFWKDFIVSKETISKYALSGLTQPFSGRLSAIVPNNLKPPMIPVRATHVSLNDPSRFEAACENKCSAVGDERPFRKVNRPIHIACLGDGCSPSDDPKTYSRDGENRSENGQPKSEERDGISRRPLPEGFSRRAFGLFLLSLWAGLELLNWLLKSEYGAQAKCDKRKKNSNTEGA